MFIKLRRRTCLIPILVNTGMCAFVEDDRGGSTIVYSMEHTVDVEETFDQIQTLIAIERAAEADAAKIEVSCTCESSGGVNHLSQKDVNPL